MENNHRISNEILEKNLDRIIGFVANCDSKVSYLLTFVGVIITILLTIKSPHLHFINPALNSTDSTWLLTLSIGVIGVVFAISLLVLGTYHLSKALIGKTERNPENTESLIFFGAISDRRNSEEYLSIINNEEYSYRNDLASQIYNNSKICTEKFDRYNKGFKLIRYGLPMLIIFWLFLF